MSAKSLANLKPAQKGDVRNPKGRPRGVKDKRTQAAEALLTLGTKVHTMPIDFLMLCMNDVEQLTHFRFRCAVELLPYCHRRQPVAIDGGEGKPLMGATIDPIALLALTDAQLETLLTRMDKLAL